MRVLTKKDKDINQLVDVDFNNQYLKTNFMHLSSGCLCRIDINFACRLFFADTGSDNDEFQILVGCMVHVKM